MSGVFNGILEIFGFAIGILLILRIIQIFIFPLFCYSSPRIYDNNIVINSNNNKENIIPEINIISEVDIKVLNVEDSLIENNNIPIARIV